MLRLMIMIRFSNRYFWWRQLSKSFIQVMGVEEQKKELKKLTLGGSRRLFFKYAGLKAGVLQWKHFVGE